MVLAVLVSVVLVISAPFVGEFRRWLAANAIHDPEMGMFRSRYAPAQLDALAAERAACRCSTRPHTSPRPATDGTRTTARTRDDGSRRRLPQHRLSVPRQLIREFIDNLKSGIGNRLSINRKLPITNLSINDYQFQIPDCQFTESGSRGFCTPPAFLPAVVARGRGRRRSRCPCREWPR